MTIFCKCCESSTLDLQDEHCLECEIEDCKCQKVLKKTEEIKELETKLEYLIQVEIMEQTKKLVQLNIELENLK